MWIFTAYVLSRLAKKKGTNVISLNEIYKLFFDIFWKRCRLGLVDSKEELLEELRYLESLGALTIKGDTIKVKINEIDKIASVVENSALRWELLIYKEYLSRIKEGIELL